ncbi:AbrB family transcriptional regulator [Planomicrobium sp. CPCC 101110]|uniref:AbrB family transcriptional regulator n=1 Tax=Planomicrobium sp. CPCC 101110 TaxID=2599619 RepID=UPI0011B4E27F|nr:AbrB family transcriptional regulator [Planomicrobium sp. CPCC 101110]TWT26287.1 AbrB family transcriptional regulator [Planomicrobium sp. CPCC 101110]
MNSFLKTAVIAFASGWLFYEVGMFLPWLLGPMFILLLLNQFTAMKFRWPKILRTAGLVLLGVQIGSSFTRDAVALMWFDLPYMAFMTLAIVGLSLGLGLLFRRMANESLATSLLGSIPGGLSQMVVIAEEVDSANVTVVTMMQMVRVLMVISIVPFLSIFLAGRNASEIVPETFVFAWPPFLAAIAVGLLVYWLMKKMHFPAAEVLAPIFTMALVQSITAHHILEMPVWLVALAQVFIGANLGLQMEQLREKMNLRIGMAILVNNVLLIGFSVLIAYMLAAFLPGYLFLDFFLSAAPGGMAEMAITALASGGDVALITSFHLFRLFFILLLASPIIAYVVKKLDAKTNH